MSPLLSSKVSFIPAPSFFSALQLPPELSALKKQPAKALGNSFFLDEDVLFPRRDGAVGLIEAAVFSEESRRAPVELKRGQLQRGYLSLFLLL